jgi:phage terminase large subunit-like protein
VTCEPRFASARTSRKTLGPELAASAKVIGLNLLPWQRLVASVALEQSRGRPAYRDVLVSVPRQSGKSTLTLALIVWRMTARPGSRIMYAAQTRQAARMKMLESWWPRLVASELAPDLKLYRQFGSESITHSNGSVLQLLSASETSGHGETVDLVILDEAWAHQTARIEQAVRPAMVTRRDAQLWAVSTAGTWRSVWWKGKLEAGRAAALMGVDTGTACFEWSAPDDANPADPAVWRACMPALGRLADEQTIQADLTAMGLEEFRRAYLNQWPDPLAGGWKVFDKKAWERAREED